MLLPSTIRPLHLSGLYCTNLSVCRLSVCVLPGNRIVPAGAQFAIETTSTAVLGPRGGGGPGSRLFLHRRLGRGRVRFYRLFLGRLVGERVDRIERHRGVCAEPAVQVELDV